MEKQKLILHSQERRGAKADYGQVVEERELDETSTLETSTILAILPTDLILAIGMATFLLTVLTARVAVAPKLGHILHVLH